MIHLHLPGGETVLGPEAVGKTIMELLLQAGEPVDAPCGGKGRCAKCIVTAFGELSDPDEEEMRALTASELESGVRLACRTRVLGEAHIHTGKKEKIEAVTEGAGSVKPDPWGEGIGFAADIGTTTVAGYIYDLASGRQLAASAVKNPQGAYGADVVSRQEYAMSGRGDELRKVIVDCLDALSRELCTNCGKTVGDIGAAVLTGNTTMLYLLCGYDVKEIAVAPFNCSHIFGEYRPAREFFPDWSDKCRVYLPTCISSYVGADITCAILASGVHRESGVLLADIGTNGELALSWDGKLLCCATAAGPAFEGAGISCGSGAFPGAIDKVWTENGALRWHALGEAKPVSVCGSGLLDAVASMLDVGGIDESGRFDGEWEDEDEAPIGDSGVCLTAGDIRQVQLAKAAVSAGMQTLIHYGAGDGAKVRLVIAGGFGSKLDPVSAQRVGLVLPGMAESARAVGNAAGMGAVMLLLSRECIAECESIAARAETAELASDPYFTSSFIENISFE